MNTTILHLVAIYNQYCSRELLMMGIDLPEIFCAYNKYNKIISGI